MRWRLDDPRVGPVPERDSPGVEMTLSVVGEIFTHIGIRARFYLPKHFQNFTLSQGSPRAGILARAPKQSRRQRLARKWKFNVVSLAAPPMTNAVRLDL